LPRNYIKNLVFISTVIPSDYGARSKVVYNYLKSLSNSYKYKITLILISNDTKGFTKPPFIETLYLFRQPNKISQFALILFNSLIIKKAPMQTYFYWSPLLNKKIKKLITTIDPDIVVCELIRTALYGVNLNIPKILDMADLLSRRYGQQLNNISNHSNIAGQYEKSFPKYIRKIINMNKIKYFILNTEFQLTRNFEKNIVKYFNKTTLVSINEVEMLKSDSKKENIYWLPNGVDIDEKHQKLDNYNSKNISFIGVLDNPHNEDGVLYFIDKIFPLIVKEIPDAVFQVIGRNPTNSILSREKNNIVITGFVENIDYWIKKSSITVIPLLIGSGVKTKIFESLKFGIPVVSTSLGAEGIVQELKKFIIVKDDVNEFAESCIQLLNNSVDIKELQDKSNNIITNYYSWEKVGLRFHSIIDQVLN